MVRLPKTSGNSYLEHFIETCSKRKMEKLVPQSLFGKRNIFRGNDTRYSPRRKNVPFFQSWKKLSKDHEILGKVKGYKVPLLREAVQETVPLNTPLRGSQKFLVEKASKKCWRTEQ